MTVKKKQSYIVVLDWMVEKYHLKGNELLAYALIYGFSQDEESEYKGSYSYICKWLSIDRATAIRILNRLESKGLLTKRQELVGGKATNRYIAETPEAVVPVQTDPARPENRPTSHPPDPSQNATGGEMSPVAKCDRYPSQNATQTRGKMPPSNTIGKPIGEIYLSARGADPDGSIDSHTRREAVETDFRQRLEIDTLARNPRYEPAQLEELLDNIVDMYSCEAPMQYIGQQMQTTKAIRARLDKLTSQSVEYIMESLSNTTQPIKNIRAYLRTVILNAPGTMESYYLAQANAAVAASSHPPAPAGSLMAGAVRRCAGAGCSFPAAETSPSAHRRSIVWRSSRSVRPMRSAGKGFPPARSSARYTRAQRPSFSCSSLSASSIGSDRQTGRDSVNSA